MALPKEQIEQLQPAMEGTLGPDAQIAAYNRVMSGEFGEDVRLKLAGLAAEGEFGEALKADAYTRLKSGEFGEELMVKALQLGAEGKQGDAERAVAFNTAMTYPFKEPMTKIRGIQGAVDGDFGPNMGRTAVAAGFAGTYGDELKGQLEGLYNDPRASERNYYPEVNETLQLMNQQGSTYGQPGGGFVPAQGYAAGGVVGGVVPPGVLKRSPNAKYYENAKTGELTPGRGWVVNPRIPTGILKRSPNTQLFVDGDTGESLQRFIPAPDVSGTEGYAAGGLVGGSIYSTESLDLPAGLQQLMPRGTQTNNRAYGSMNSTRANGNAPTMDFRNQPTPAYAAGGQVGPGGAPVGGAPQGAGLQGPGQTQAGAPMDPKMMEMHMQKFMREQPEKVAQIKQTIMEVVQSGELTQDELNMAVQLATVALQNPDMYPQVRQFAIQQGIATEADLGPEYDQGLIFVLLLAAKAAQSEMGGNFMEGGEIMNGSTPTADDVNINVSKGEFVIPAHVVAAKGTDFFNKMIDPKGGSTKA